MSSSSSSKSKSKKDDKKDSPNKAPKKAKVVEFHEEEPASDEPLPNSSENLAEDKPGRNRKEPLMVQILGCYTFLR